MIGQRCLGDPGKGIHTVISIIYRNMEFKQSGYLAPFNQLQDRAAAKLHRKSYFFIVSVVHIMSTPDSHFLVQCSINLFLLWCTSCISVVLAQMFVLGVMFKGLFMYIAFIGL